MKPNSGITVLGVDPGVNNFGYGLVLEDTNSLKALVYGQYTVPRKISFDEKLFFIGKKFCTIIEETKPDFIAIEKIYVAKNTQIALSIGIVSGVIASFGISSGIKVNFITPGEIKKTITGAGQAMKQQVCYMVQKILGLQEDPGEHAIDALAAAISFISIYRFQNLIGKS
ncbi:MAG: crossover junction endodeoxyribonuclease RuvC [Candidatus Omnitrophica bacterium]|nr:crossover junction endodeoxyribonuclease RuvC [Candidatus Omnitrophota bacterium]MCM8817642.1 crossover junction endodeoxyribonuclease RuvC [Candidatus Omnitrophota bacterium]